MTSISSISAYSALAPTAPPARIDPDQDGDNDKGKSAASEATERSSRGPATTVTLSPAAQALIQTQKA